jgi:BirA family biotin operon repressor/biotin-[acetyl-CoA-carboxylase] ligase
VTAPQPFPPEFAQPMAHVRSRLGVFASPHLWFEDIGSTNTAAVRLAERGAKEGSVIAANAQRAGRGRLGRSWASPSGAGLYASVVLRPRAPSSLVSIAAGVAIAQGVQAATGLAVGLKWPNDVYVGLRKVAGILAEAGQSPSGAFVVVGFGINVFRASYPSDVADRATSIEAELGRPPDRGLLFAEVLAALAEIYADMTGGGASGILDRWRERAGATLGRSVEWTDSAGTHRGTTRDIDGDGALIIETDGGVRRVIAGEIRWS